jgi:hypothetical protein
VALRREQQEQLGIITKIWPWGGKARLNTDVITTALGKEEVAVNL